LVECGLGLDEPADVLADDEGWALREIPIDLDADLAWKPQRVAEPRAQVAGLLEREGGRAGSGKVSRPSEGQAAPEPRSGLLPRRVLPRRPRLRQRQRDRRDNYSTVVVSGIEPRLPESRQGSLEWEDEDW